MMLRVFETAKLASYEMTELPRPALLAPKCCSADFDDTGTMGIEPADREPSVPGRLPGRLPGSNPFGN